MSTDSPIKYNPDRVLTQAQKDINDDHHYWDWFDAWWDQDFSWEGLAKRKIIDHSDGRTLQDYWREEELEGRLINFAGRKWTRFHLPMHDKGGKIEEELGKHWVDDETWKEEKWRDWHDSIIKKLGEASCYLSKSPDTRAQFTGLNFPRLFRLPFFPRQEGEENSIHKTIIHIKADWVHFSHYTILSEIQFGDNSFFNHSKFGNHVTFEKSKFGNNSSFENALFGEFPNFSHTQFNYGVIFIRCQFTDMTTFENAKFGDNANFESANFGEMVSFEHVKFEYETVFSYAKFGDGASFHHAQFGGWETFYCTQFGYNCSFENAIFKDGVSFKDKAFQNLNSSFIKRTGSLCFDCTVFEASVDFTDRQFGADSSFNFTKFLGPAIFHGSTFHSSIRFDEAEFSVVPGTHYTKNPETYQSAFQTLRLHMEKLRNHAQENKFSKLEMQARERRVGSKDVPWWVRYLSKGYGLFADYGQSAWRPFLWLIGFYLLAAGLYASIVGNWPIPGDAFSVAFQYSLPPVSTFAAQFFAGEVDQSFINALLDHPFLTRLVMVSHGVTSLALVFFLLLALKRRFQIR